MLPAPELFDVRTLQGHPHPHNFKTGAAMPWADCLGQLQSLHGSNLSMPWNGCLLKSLYNMRTTQRKNLASLKFVLVHFQWLRVQTKSEWSYPHQEKVKVPDRGPQHPQEHSGGGLVHSSNYVVWLPKKRSKVVHSCSRPNSRLNWFLPLLIFSVSFSIRVILAYF